MDTTEYIVRSHYSFWDEPDRYYSKSFNSLWRAFDYYNGEDHIDTSHSFFRVKGGVEVEIPLRLLERKWEKHYIPEVIPDTALSIALKDPLWSTHEVGDRYLMDNKGHWTLTYYPIFGCGKTNEEYDESRALVECPKKFGEVMGIDIREVPLRYLERKGV